MRRRPDSALLVGSQSPPFDHEPLVRSPSLQVSGESPAPASGWRRSLCFREASGPGLIPAFLGSLMGLPPGLVRAVKGPMVRVGPLTPHEERSPARIATAPVPAPSAPTASPSHGSDEHPAAWITQRSAGRRSLGTPGLDRPGHPSSRGVRTSFYERRCALLATFPGGLRRLPGADGAAWGTGPPGNGGGRAVEGGCEGNAARVPRVERDGTT